MKGFFRLVRIWPSGISTARARVLVAGGPRCACNDGFRCQPTTCNQVVLSKYLEGKGSGRSRYFWDRGDWDLGAEKSAIRQLRQGPKRLVRLIEISS